MNTPYLRPAGTSATSTRKSGKVLPMPNFNNKSKSAYNKKADNYDDTFDGRFTQKFKRLLVSEIELPEKSNVLDIACGNGSLLAKLNEKMSINGFGVDISNRMIEIASAKNPGMEFHAADCEAIPFADSSMDVITVCAAYHHFPNAAAFAREARRVLKPLGRAYVAEIHLPFLLRLAVNPFVPLSKAGDVKFYSPKEIACNFERFGFDSADIKIFGHVQIMSVRKI